MKTYICSDLHFFHSNILKYCPRPYQDVDEMTQRLLHLFKANVENDDHVYHLGDFMFGNPKLSRFYELFDLLPGKWHFILGNHDKNSIQKWQKQLIVHERIEEICDYKTINDNGKFYVLFHYELKEWDRKHHGSYHLFGHSHSAVDRVYDGNSMDVGIDGTGYKLLTLQQITKQIDERNCS